MQVDVYLWEHPQHVILYAAGNDGAFGKNNTIGSPAQSKNGIAVGASGDGRYGFNPQKNAQYVASFSSSGPTKDMRIKPDFVSPGQNVISANSGGYGGSPTCSVFQKSGTSMATPGAAGAAALVRDYLTSGVFAAHLSAVSADLGWTCLPGYVCTPMALDGAAAGPLVKAMLIHSTVAMALWDARDKDQESRPVPLAAPPDFYQGFGRIDLSSVLLPPSSTPATTGAGLGLGLWCTDSSIVSSGASVTYTFRVVSAARPFKATLVWYDPPNYFTFATKMLLNDLDLTVTGPGGSSDSYFSNGATSSAQQDVRNTVEKIWLPSPAVGDYTITVKASTLTTSAQPFALVLSGAGYLVGPGQTFAALQAGGSAACPAGTARSGGSSCVACGAGYFSSGGASTCSACSAGTFAVGLSSTVCSPCPAGSSSAATGAQSSAPCAACAEGKASVAGSSSCMSCPAGMYSSGSGNANCSACSGGRYSATSGSKVCTLCAVGKANVESMPNCLSGPPCQVGEYKDTTTNTCGACVPGFDGLLISEDI